LPETWLTKINLSGIVDTYGVPIGIAFVLSLSILIVEIVVVSHKRLGVSRAKAKAESNTLLALSQLDEQERAVLREYFVQGQHTIYMPVADPVVAGLLDKGILRQIRVMYKKSIHGPLVSISLSETVKPFFNRATVDLPDHDLTPEEKEWVMQNRPSFTRRRL